MPPRCRSIGGVVYDLIASERQAPCARGRARKASEKRPSSKPPSEPATNTDAGLRDRVAKVLIAAEQADGSFTVANIGEAAGFRHRPDWEVGELVKLGALRVAAKKPGDQVDTRYELVPKRAPRAKPMPRERFGRKEKLRPLPPMITGPLKVGDHVSVLSYGSNDVDHGVVDALPNPTATSIYQRSTEPTILFTTGEIEGFRRHIPMTRLRAGWLERGGWKPWRG